MNPPSPGSRLDADHPENGVLIPWRFTLIRRIVVIGLHRRLLQCPIHALDLAVRPRMADFREAMFDAERSAGRVEWMGFALGVAARQQEIVGELRAVVGEDLVYFVGNGLRQVPHKGGGRRDAFSGVTANPALG